MQSQNDRMISVHFQGKPFSVIVIQVYAPTNNAEEAEVEPIRPRTNTQKRCPFHFRGLECISRKSRYTWSNGQTWPWSTEWSRAKVNRVLPIEFCHDQRMHWSQQTPSSNNTEKTLHMDITKWSIPKSDWLYSLQPKMESSIQSAKTRLEADCGSDHELLIAEFRPKLKKVRKTTRPCNYDLIKSLMIIE